MANKRLPIFLKLPIKHKSIVHEPMLEQINIRPFLKKYGHEVKCVAVGGESGENARICKYEWIVNTRNQCVSNNVSFVFRQTGANFVKNERLYHISRENQISQAEKAGINFKALNEPVHERKKSKIQQYYESDYDADKVASLMQRTKQKQNMVLGDAYDNDFLTIPESKFADGLESYSHMSREAVTTNRDARDVLFSKHNFGEQDRLLQNKYIDKMSDDDIFDAVSKANGYGRRYIERLKAEGKLTPKKAKQFREAMKYVGVVATPVSVGLTATGISSKTSYKK